MMNREYFSDLFPVLSDRAKLSAIGRLGFANVPLQKHLFEVFSRPYGETGAFLADPTFEAVFGWKKGNYQMSDLAGTLLSSALVKAMDAPPKELEKDYRFKKDQHPYEHQIEAWKILSEPEPKSLIVASGTGSGKTECFMVPILDSLVREKEKVGGKLIGVRALFLYPLNALINSQRDRFRAWTNHFGSDIRFCLYNGNTPETEPSRVQRDYPSEVFDRKTLRSSPPPLLVTNATMLEYMLVRSSDAPIIAQSQGKLQWVVLDEAHTYVGSQAAEAALLIRRVLLAFGVKSEDVRFVATSATIGDPHGDAGRKLKRFLADVAGVSEENVYLVAGEREIPKMNAAAPPSNTGVREINKSLNNDLPDENLYEHLTNNSTARHIRRLFTVNPAKPIAKLSKISEAVFGHAKPFSAAQSLETLRWLDLLTRAQAATETNEAGQSFLPLRAHVFHQTLSGIWACADANCRFREGTDLESKEWSFGKIFFEPRKHCNCQSPVYEVVKCGGCGTVHLKAGLDSAGLITQMQPPGAIDEFELESESSNETSETDDADDAPPATRQFPILIVNQNIKRVGALHIERQTRRRVDAATDATLTVQAYEDDGHGLICPVCEEREATGKPLFQASRIGAPFLISGILPTLLEYAPDGEQPADHPYRGRRLLSFNDSRQGTARMAARLQQEAERNRIRGLIYHLALSEGIGNKTVETNNLLDQINQLKSVVNQPLPENARAALESQIDGLQKQLSELSDPSLVSFNEMARKLTVQGRDFDLMLKQYRQYAPGTFSEAAGQLELAKTFLVREFGRRPKFLNSLETMGMVAVQYPALKNIHQIPMEAALAADFTLEEWRDFLKICLDFFVRGGGSLEISPTWRNWLGMRYPQKTFVSRDEDFVSRRQRAWLRARRSGKRSNIVRLLMFVLNTDIATAEGEDRVDSILGAAWSDLVVAGLLKQTSDGRVLALEQLAFAPIESAWICPVTRRFLDTTLRGITPYLPETPSEETARCELVRIPLYDEPFGGVTDDLERIRKGREWLKNRNDIGELRNQGLWTAPNDRVIELSPYFTAAEHSAQQDSATLQRYEKNFKTGALNLLSCSTTMEMGIDIGGISVVAMNNVPPHPANYLQRAGRAGRRREARSLAVTLCKSNPHDQNVFSQTRWAFDNPIPAPSVSLDSPVIIQRHLNSFLLTKFFRERFSAVGQETTKLTCGLFFIGNESAAAKFSAWCRNFEQMKTDENLIAGVKQIVRHSILESHSLNQLLECAAGGLEKIAVEWHEEWKLLEDEERAIQQSDGEKSPAYRAVSIHKSRLSDEYLLRELATRGFLPAYGFPTNLAAFDNLTVGQFIKNLRSSADKNSREDNRYRRRELASRDLTTALREYAPGSEVVIDGLVYTSAGVTLNWHIPADQQEIREIQNIRFAWRCRQCGSSGSSFNLNAARNCHFCGASIGGGDVREFLEPSGFAVDFYSEPGNDVSSQHFVPVEAPWIDADGDWFPLTNPDLGRFRVSTRGHVFNQSRGIYGGGYALCLECGRAEPMLPETDDLPKVFQNPHRKLRRTKEDGVFCPGSSNQWKIKRGIALGHETRTDIFELQLKSANGIWLNDPVIALTLAVALRDALAELLGVQAAELGCEAKPARTDSNGICQSIIIFDRYAAGYASSADRFFANLFQAARNRLECQANCDSVCPHCVLDYDQRFAADKLDRRVALEFLTDEWLNGFRLPENLAFFGADSCLEHNIFPEALQLAVSRRSVSLVRFYTSGEAEDWDVAVSSLRSLAYKIAAKNIQVEFMITKNILNKLSLNDRFLLAGIAEHPQIALRELNFEPHAGDGWVLAEAIGENSIRWAMPEQHSLFFDAEWGSNTNVLIKAENNPPFICSDKIFDVSELRPNVSEFGDKEFEITNELNGSLQNFGTKFWDFIFDHHSVVETLFENDALQSVSYSDRYLFSPINIALFFQIIKALKVLTENKQSNSFSVLMNTTDKSNFNQQYNPQNKVQNDWRDSADRDRITQLIFEHSDIALTVRIGSKSEVGHGRILELEFSSGKKLFIRLDQGVSFWKPAWAVSSSIIAYNFNAPEMQQRDLLLNLDLNIKDSDSSTQIFLKVRN